MRKLLFVPLVLVAAITISVVWSSSPTVPLTLTRQQAIARAATDATVSGTVVWTQIESKLVTYGEWDRVFGFTPGLGYVDTTDRDALVWVVAYLGPMVSISPDYCEWAVRAFRADSSIASDWGGSSCGKGQWPSGFDLLPDRSWFRLNDLRGSIDGPLAAGSFGGARRQRRFRQRPDLGADRTDQRAQSE
jgi:hypothetical protein